MRCKKHTYISSLKIFFMNETAIEILQELGIETTHSNETLMQLSVAESKYLRDLKMNVKSVLTTESISPKGRIYSGVDAKAIGLIDNIGTLDDAIAEAKKLAKLNAINIVQYPAVKDGYELFLNTFLNESEEHILAKFFRKEISSYKEIEKLKQYTKPQARIPFVFNIH